MAVVIEPEDWPGGPVYRWEEWLDGRPWVLSLRTDFETTPEQFRNSAYQAAKRMGCRVRTRIVGTDVYLQRIE